MGGNAIPGLGCGQAIDGTIFACFTSFSSSILSNFPAFSIFTASIHLKAVGRIHFANFGIRVNSTIFIFRNVFTFPFNTLNSGRSSHHLTPTTTPFITNTLFFSSSPRNDSLPNNNDFNSLRSIPHSTQQYSLSNTTFSQRTKQPSPTLTS